jgi:hypothetical protein
VESGVFPSGPADDVLPQAGGGAAAATTRVFFLREVMLHDDIAYGIDEGSGHASAGRRK